MGARVELGWFETDFLRRAIAAAFGWRGAGPHSHTAAFLFKDGAGNALDGHAHRYTMTFDADNLPPVRNHWALPDPRQRRLLRRQRDRPILTKQLHARPR